MMCAIKLVMMKVEWNIPVRPSAYLLVALSLGGPRLRERLCLWAIGFTLSLFLLWSTTTSVDKPVGHLLWVSTLWSKSDTEGQKWQM